ncbi:MAG TPA: hypothetical protein VHX17_05575 [Candidatus Cybelea sp.]|jgi:hypothetical protein|nr:hypothetical protein [Candidatus Cybelea sp.]
MEADVRTKLVAVLAERGLTLTSFDGKTLFVQYDPPGDSEVQKGHGVDAGSLSRYVQDVIAVHPGSETMFPGLVDVEVELPKS